MDGYGYNTFSDFEADAREMRERGHLAEHERHAFSKVPTYWRNDFVHLHWVDGGPGQQNVRVEPAPERVAALTARYAAALDSLTDAPLRFDPRRGAGPLLQAACCDETFAPLFLWFARKHGLDVNVRHRDSACTTPEINRIVGYDRTDGPGGYSLAYSQVKSWTRWCVDSHFVHALRMVVAAGADVDAPAADDGDTIRALVGRFLTSPEPRALKWRDPERTPAEVELLTAAAVEEVGRVLNQFAPAVAHEAREAREAPVDAVAIAMEDMSVAN